MALSTTEETIVSGTVGKVTYDLTFEGYVDNPPGYIKKAHVFLWINDVQQTVGGGGTEYGGSGVTFTWDTATRVTIAGYSPVLNDKIEFRRTMPTDKPVVDFVDRAGITETMLDNSNLANLYAVHEIKDGFGTGTQNYYALAKLYANGDEDYEVEPGQYSAYHWSLKAEDEYDLAETARAAAVVAQGLAEDAEDAAVVAQGLAEDAQAAAEAIDAYTKAEADAITDPIAADVATNASDISDLEAAVAGKEDADTAIAKTDEANVWTELQRPTKQTLSSSGAAVAWDLSGGAGYGELELDEDTTLGLPSNLADGAVFFMNITQDSTGDWTLSFNASIDFGAEDVPEMPATATTGQMILAFLTDGTNVFCWEVWRSE